MRETLAESRVSYRQREVSLITASESSERTREYIQLEMSSTIKKFRIRILIRIQEGTLDQNPEPDRHQNLIDWSLGYA